MSARTVVVTGGSSGIGRAIAARFASASDQVWVSGRNVEKLNAVSAQLGVTALQCDHTVPGDIEALRTRLPDQIDVLVHAAGANTHSTPAAGGDVDLAQLAADWQTGLAANLLTAVLTTAALLPRVPAGGAIVAIGSEASEMAATSYGAAKAALAAWTAGLSRMIGSRGITVNTVTPNYTEGTDFYATPLPERQREMLIRSTHNGRAGKPEDVAGAVFFLAGPEARHVTAQNVHVSGGIYISR